MKIEKHDPGKHFGTEYDDYDLVLSHGNGDILFSEGQAFEAATLLIEYLHGDEDEIIRG